MGKRSRSRGSKLKSYKAPSVVPSESQIYKDRSAMKNAAMYSGAGGAYDYNRLGSGRQAAQAYNQQVNQYTDERVEQAAAQRKYDDLRTTATQNIPRFGKGKRGNRQRQGAAKQKVRMQDAAGIKRPEITAQAPQAYQPAPNVGYNSAARNVGGPNSMSARMANLRNKAGRSRSPASQTQSSESAAASGAQGSN